MRKIFMLFVLLVASLGFASGAHAYFYCDTCDSYSSDHWGEESGSWSYDGGQYSDGGHHDGYDSGGGHHDGMGGRGGMDSWVDESYGDSYSSFTAYENAEHFTVDLDIGNVGYGGIYLRSYDDDHGVVLVVVGAGGTYKDTYYDKGGLYWYVRDGRGEWGDVQQYSYGAGLDKGDDIHLKVVAHGDSYSAYIDGAGYGDTHVSTYYNDTDYGYKDHEGGHIALYDYTGHKYDNFCVVNPHIDPDPEPAPVPEPSTYLLLGSGLMGLVVWRRRKVKRG